MFSHCSNGVLASLRAFRGHRAGIRAIILVIAAGLAAASARAQETEPAPTPPVAESDDWQGESPADQPLAEPAPVNLMKAQARPEPVLSITPAADPDLSFHRSLYYCAKRGALWLKSAQRPDGLFVYGWLVGLNRPMPGDNQLRQAGAAYALARAAATTGDRETALAARQAIVVLLSTGTEADPGNPDVRRPTLPPADANPVGFAALVLLAISELPDPTDALIEQGERLARFLASRQRPDGSINVSASLEADGPDAPESIAYYPGEALYALLRSHAHRPEPYKLEAATRALPYYRRHFREQPTMAFVPWQTSAMAEAYLLTKNPEMAEFIFEMTDWIRKMQYLDRQSTPGHWIGGFGSYHEGRWIRTPPGASTASYAEGLVDACRVARLAGDDRRRREYQSALQLAFLFLMNHQYTSSTSAHLEKWYARKLSGAFLGGAEDGDVRIDYTQHAVCGMFHYLNHVVGYDNPDQQKLRLHPGAPRAN